jgi:predicted dehydrogenase
MRAIVAGTAFGARIHVRALKAVGVVVEGLVGRDPARTRHKADRAGVPRAFTDFATALDVVRPQIVAIATPPATHAAFARMAIESGAHVLCEKPFTLDASEAEDLVRRAAAAGVVCYLGHEFRFSECAALVSHLLVLGTIGEPRLATFVAQNSLVADTDRPLADWWFDPAQGGGWLGASGSHAVDRIRQWFGELDSLAATTSVTSNRHNVADDGFTMSFKTNSGVPGAMQTTAGAWGPGLCIQRISGTAGTLWIEDTTGMGTIESARGPVYLANRRGARPMDVPPEIKLGHLPGLDPRYGRSVLPYLRVYQFMIREITGEPHPNSAVRPATFADGAANMRVLDAIRASSAQGGATVQLRPADPALKAARRV